jgi:hypothetical protein
VAGAIGRLPRARRRHLCHLIDRLSGSILPPTVKFSLPTKKQLGTWALWLLGAVALKTVANIFSDSLVMPALHTVSRWVLDLASLGLASYKNGVYKEIAADNQSGIAVATLIWVTLIYLMIIVRINVDQYQKNDRARSRSERLLKKLSGTAPNPVPVPVPVPVPAITMDTLRQQVAALLKSVQRGRWLIHFSSLTLVLLLVVQVVSLARETYATSADGHYHQVLRVASPFLDAREQAEVESDFAQIGSRDDYVRLLSRLEGQCKAHGKTVPKFDPW